MSERTIGEIKHTVSNVVGAVHNNSKKLTLFKIQLHYLLKRIEFLEEKAGEKYVAPGQQNKNKPATRQTRQTRQTPQPHQTPQANKNSNVININ